MRNAINKIALAALSLTAATWLWTLLAPVVLGPTLPRDWQNRPLALAKRMGRRFVSDWGPFGSRSGMEQSMRALNPEWDLMSRMFTVLGIANLAVEAPEKQRGEYLRTMDRIIKDTEQTIRENGFTSFLMAYGRGARTWGQMPPRSLFVDGEVALILGARRMVEDNADLKRRFQDLIRFVDERMRNGTVLCAESYPNECWLFCNSVALAALRMSDRLDGTRHEAFFEKWVGQAKARLIDASNGGLISTFALDGTPLMVGHGVEGSSLWLAAHMLQVVNADFARTQYDVAVQTLQGDFMGFSYSREWPKGVGPMADIDSGPSIPFLGASASASGLALVASRSFGDRTCYRRMMASLNLVGFPVRRAGGLSYAAANEVGDAVAFYAASSGPLWEKLRPEAPREQ